MFNLQISKGDEEMFNETLKEILQEIFNNNRILIIISGFNLNFNNINYTKIKEINHIFRSFKFKKVPMKILQGLLLQLLRMQFMIFLFV